MNILQTSVFQSQKSNPNRITVTKQDLTSNLISQKPNNKTKNFPKKKKNSSILREREWERRRRTRLLLQRSTARGGRWTVRWKANGQVEGERSGERWDLRREVEGERLGGRWRQRRSLGRWAQATTVLGSVSSSMKLSSSPVEVFLVRESGEWGK